MFKQKNIRAAIMQAFNDGTKKLYEDTDTGAKILIRSMPCGAIDAIIRLSIYRAQDQRILALEYPIYLGLDAIAGEFNRSIKQALPLLGMAVPPALLQEDMSGIDTEDKLTARLKELDQHLGFLTETQYWMCAGALGVRGKNKLPDEFHRNRFYFVYRSPESEEARFLEDSGLVVISNSTFYVTDHGQRFFRMEHARRQNRFYTSVKTKEDVKAAFTNNQNPI